MNIKHDVTMTFSQSTKLPTGYDEQDIVNIAMADMSHLIAQDIVKELFKATQNERRFGNSTLTAVIEVACYEWLSANVFDCEVDK